MENNIKSQKRQRIADKAWELFRKNGYEETKVEDITRELGISKGSFYTYFKTKEEVLCEILELKKKEMTERLEKIDINQEPSKILEDYIMYKMDYTFKILDNKRIDNINRHLLNPKIQNFLDEARNISVKFIEDNIINKFNIINKNKYNSEIISEFIFISISEFLYNEFTYKNSRSGKFLNIENINKVKNSLKEVTKFLENALK